MSFEKYDYSQPSPFHYSTLNYDLAHSTPSDTINIFWNEQMQKMNTDTIMYMTPNFDPTIGYIYPEFGMWGNNLLNPMLAIQQTMYAFQNGSWMSGMNGVNGGMFGFQPWNTNPWGNNNNSSTTTGNSEYDALKALITRYKEIGVKNNSLSPEAIDKINAALNKSGKPEEKLQALKDLYKSLNKNKLEKALLSLPEYKEALASAGYNLNGMNKEDDKELKSNLNRLETNIVSRGSDTGGLEDLMTSGNVLRAVSYWNDTHSDENSRGIIRLVVKHLPSDNSEKEKHINLVTKLANALVNRADDLKSELEGSYPKLDAAKQKVADASNKIKDGASCTSKNLTDLADAFDELYAMLRMMEAERIRNNIKTQYSFINNISSTDTDFVNDDLVVKATREDLKKEGITAVPETDDIPVEEREEISDIDERLETPEEKIEELYNKENIDKTAKDEVYQTKTTSENEPPHLYMVKDDKLVELKDVKAIDKDGNCTMIDGTTKKKLEEVETVEVSGQDIIDYQKEVERVDDLEKNGSLVKKNNVPGMPAGVQLYRSKGNKEDGFYEYYVVRNNKLMKIDCVNLDDQGWFIKELGNNNKKMYNQLTDSDFVEAGTINTEDLKAKKAKEDEEAAKKEEEDKKAEEAKNPPAIDKNSTDYTSGVDVYDKLAGPTGGLWRTDNWPKVQNTIKTLTKDSIRNFIAGYESKRTGIHLGDTILEQIAEEYESTGFLGLGSTFRNGRKDLINHIIKCVIDYCEEHPELKDKDAYKHLVEKYKDGNGITKDDLDNHSEDEKNDDGSVKGIRGLDHLILELLEINT